jgi:hypothetical protein
MVAPENVMSVGGQHALRDMVEFEMYLVSQPRQTPWTMLPRRNKKLLETKKPDTNLVESSVAMELLEQGFIEATSSRTFVVSKYGSQFYERKIKPGPSLVH